MATNIGPKIYIDGWADYRRQLQSIMNDTKMLNSEMKKLTSSFDADNKTVKTNADQKRLLAAQIDKLNQQLKIQQSALKECATQLNDNGEHTEKMAEDTKKWQTEVNKTEAELNKLKGQLNDMPTSLEVVKQAIENNNSAWKRNAEIMASVGTTMTKYVSLPIMAGLTASVKAAADWESGFTGVKKTVDEVYDANGNLVYSYQELDKALRDVAGNSVIAYDELLATAEISGQLGIGAKEVAQFSEIMLKLGASTTMSSEEAATAIAKILNITNKGMPITIDQTERFANVLVELGNNFATTEGDITLMATRLASAGTVAGLTTDEILALSTAMSSVGIRAEAGGSSMAQVLVNLEKRVANFKEKGGNSLDLVAKLAGTTAEEFAEAWGKKPIDAISAFIKGLGSLDEEAQSTSIILEELEMDGIRQSNMIKALSQAYPLLARAIGMANSEWNNGNALAEEYAKREETLNAQIQKFKNNIGLLGVEIGETLLPSINKLLENFLELVRGFRELNPGTKEAIAKLGLFVAAIGPALTAVSKMVIAFSNLNAGLSALGLGKTATDLTLLSTNAGTAANALGGSGGSLLAALQNISASKVVQAGGLAALILYAGYAAFNFEKEVENWKGTLTGLSEFIDDLGTGAGDLIARFFGYENWEEASLALEEGTNTLKEQIQTWSEETFGSSGITGNAMDNLIKDVYATESEIERTINEKGLIIAGQVDDLGNELIAITQDTNATIEQETDNHFRVVDTAVKGYKTSTIQDFEETEQGMIKAIEDNRANLVSAMEQTCNEAKAPAEALKEQSPSWGSDMIQGFINGITSMYGAVASAVSGVANTVASWLHFSKPDIGPLREYEKWMPDFMQGLANGIEANKWRVEEALGDLTTTMAISAETPTKNVGSSFNYGGVVINLNVPEGANGQMLVDEIEQELVERTMRRRAVFGQ